MSKTVEVEVFKYAELEPRAQQKVKEWYIEGMNYEWWEGVYEMAITDGYEKGFCIDTINFSGFCSQGDGACWQGQVDVRQWLETHADDSIGISAWCALIQEDVISKHIKVVANTSHYCHESTMQVGELEDHTDEFVDDWQIELPSIFKGMEIQHLFDIILSDSECPFDSAEAIALEIAESAKDYARNIYSQLREEYEYLCSEEMMLDHFDCKDYHFDEDGRLA
jgi:hypothetical protein